MDQHPYLCGAAVHIHLVIVGEATLSEAVTLAKPSSQIMVTRREPDGQRRAEKRAGGPGPGQKSPKGKGPQKSQKGQGDPLITWKIEESFHGPTNR